LRGKQIVCMVLCLVLLNGCGAEQEIPELIEPVVNNESFRPVEYGSVSKMEIQIADVVPEEYCHFATKAATLDEICVDLGQYVEEGDMLATIDVSDARMELTAKQKELDLCKNNYSYQEKIYKEQIQIEKYKKADFKNKKDKKSLNKCDTALQVLEANKHYGKLLYEHQLTMLEEEITKLQENVAEGTIRATHSGYVTYVKNLEKTNSISAYENVVIVSDYEELHLELSEDISSRFYTHYIGDVYNQIYANVNGKQREVEVYEYSNQELVAMQSAGSFSRIRLELDGLNADVTVGDKMLVYFTNSNKEHVLRIGTDSLYSDGKNHFVYVKKGNSKEKREIQIGHQGEVYVEIIDGLKEGEWVYYSSGSIMPEQYEMYTVENSDYTPTNGDLNLKGSLAYTKMYPYTFEKDAVVKAIYFANGDEVKKGDLICVLDAKTGSAQLKEMKQNMSNLTQDYESNMDSLDKQIKELNKQIKNGKKKKNDKNEEGLTKDSKEQKTTLVEQLQCQKTILQYEKKKMQAQYEYDYQMLQQEYERMLETNSGQGSLEIYAEQDGILNNLNVYEDKEWKAEEGTILFHICDADSKKLFVNTKTDYVGVGNQISVKNGEDYNLYHTGIVVGNSVTEKAYVAMKEDKVYITQNGGIDSDNKVYVSMQDISMDEENWRNEIVGNQVSYSLANLRNVVVIPSTMLYEEVNRQNSESKQYYVWKIVEDILVKQYVQIEENFDTSNQVCILDGLETGDILAKPRVNEE